MGQKISKLAVIHPKTKTYFVQHLTLYPAIRCSDCPLRCACHKAKGERVIQVNHRLGELKAKARDLLMSPKGREHRSQRPADV